MASKTLIFIGFTLIITSCSSQTANDMRRVTKDSSETEKYFENNQGNEKASTSLGTVSKGSLINGKLMPFEGDNFYYFDTASYLNHRAYVNHDLKNTLLDGYSELDSIYPGRAFVLMECSNKKGGKLFPHRTHQNGLSVDFMMPRRFAATTIAIRSIVKMAGIFLLNLLTELARMITNAGKAGRK